MEAIKRSIVAVFAPVLLLALPACEKKVEKQDLAALFTGDEVTLPPPFAGLELGMSEAAAKAVLPDTPRLGSISSEQHPDVQFQAAFVDDRLSHAYLILANGEVSKLMTAQWGSAQQATDASGKQLLWWFNPEAELRVSLDESFNEDQAYVEFTRYWSLVKFLGEGPELAFQAHAPLLGLSATELDAKYGSVLIKDAAEVYLEYPPLEWGELRTLVHVEWTEVGKIRRVWFSVDFGPNPAAKHEFTDLLKKKWGDPKAHDSEVMVFSEDPVIEVKASTDHWTIILEPKSG